MLLSIALNDIQTSIESKISNSVLININLVSAIGRISTVASKSKDELAKSSFNSVTKGIRSQNPSLSQDDAEYIANELLHEIGRRLSKGEKPAFVGRDKDGKFKLSVIDLEQIDEDE